MHREFHAATPEQSGPSYIENRTALGCELAAEAVRTFGSLRVRVFGTSMTPAILPGDTLSIEKTSVNELSTGEIAIFAREGRLFAHRVIGLMERDGHAHLLTRGDRLSYTDEPVSAAELIGRAQGIERGAARLRPDARLKLGHHAILPLLRVSDWATYAYVRLAKWLGAARTECRA